MIPAWSLLLALAGCAKFGQVTQGRVIDYDAGKGTVTLIQDSNYMQPGNPRFDVLPPVTVRVPLNRAEMGPAPEAGKMLALDVASRRVVIFDSAAQALRTIEFAPVAQVEKVAAEDPRAARDKFPRVDRMNKTVTVYSAAEKRLVTFAVPDPYLNLPDDTWKMGDEVRYYYKDPGQALRMMNITRTDLTKGK